MNLVRICAVVSAVFQVSCAADDSPISSSSEAIIGGQTASAGDFPTVVAIVNNGLCTGTLIAPDLVLTAAHCVLPSLLGYTSQAQLTAATRVVFDSANIRGGGGFPIQAAETIPHPAFTTSSTGDNDIGLIRLSQPLTDRDPTPINRIYEDAAPGVTVTQVGYGVSQPGNQASAGQLFFVPAKTSTACQPFGAGNDANLICFSQADGHGKCEGDSGGPSFVTIDGVERVVGVTSFGDRDCAQFGADTRVDGELDFLFQHEPALQCQHDGACNDACGRAGLPEDVDCPTCTEDTDCGDGNLACVDGACQARPLTPGGLGSVCASSDECDSGRCAAGPDGMRCTDLCTPEGNECPEDFDCMPAGAQHACWPGADGGGTGCSLAADRGEGSGALLLCLLVGIALTVRRRAS